MTANKTTTPSLLTTTMRNLTALMTIPSVMMGGKTREQATAERAFMRSHNDDHRFDEALIRSAYSDEWWRP